MSIIRDREHDGGEEVLGGCPVVMVRLCYFTSTFKEINGYYVIVLFAIV
jgi:hypothetical protein